MYRKELDRSMNKFNYPLGIWEMLKLYDKSQYILSKNITPLYYALEKI